MDQADRETDPADGRFQGYVEPVRLSDAAARRSLYTRGLPVLIFERNPEWPVPNEGECRALWDKYAMPEHIRAHSRMVADFATAIAVELEKDGAAVHPPSVLAAGLLHDLGKYYTITHGGSHGQVGCAWVMHETRNPHIAQGVLQHVRWVWRIDETVEPWLLAYCIIYADKRVMHDAVVSLEQRYADLVVRYGHSDDAKRRIAGAHQQGLDIEAALSRRLRIPLHEYTVDSRRLVKRA
ncbi:MAG: HDIG domain-containing protein [Deltaproteobacteria bacterium]|jgi:putative nucleotidyltransferase with HDIG domain|nr:HDIG domain-containing protein [Deltaproteobacteria bacterium]